MPNESLQRLRWTQVSSFLNEIPVDHGEKISLHTEERYVCPDHGITWTRSNKCVYC